MEHPIHRRGLESSRSGKLGGWAAREGPRPRDPRTALRATVAVRLGGKSREEAPSCSRCRQREQKRSPERGRGDVTVHAGSHRLCGVMDGEAPTSEDGTRSPKTNAEDARAREGGRQGGRGPPGRHGLTSARGGSGGHRKPPARQTDPVSAGPHPARTPDHPPCERWVQRLERTP